MSGGTAHGRLSALPGFTRATDDYWFSLKADAQETVHWYLSIEAAVWRVPQSLVPAIPLPFPGLGLRFPAAVRGERAAHVVTLLDASFGVATNVTLVSPG